MEKGKPLYERQTDKPPKPKTQLETHMKTVVGELGLVITRTTSTKTTP